MCGFTFTVFLSAFQLLPTAPYHILELGGSKFAAGLFLGLLTYSSALLRLPSPAAWPIASASGGCSSWAAWPSPASPTVYAFLHDYRILLALVLLHGVFWSGLLSASSAYITDIVPAEPARGRHQLLGPVEHPGHRGGAAGRLRDLRAGMELGVRGHRALEPRHGRHRLDGFLPTSRPRPGTRTTGRSSSGTS